MKAKEVLTEKGEDGLAMAPWVDGSIRPKKHGLFEGHFKGEPGKIRKFFWSGRRWCFKNFLGKWVVSAFGEKGDKWRGLCDPTDVPIQVVDGVHSFPDNPAFHEVYRSAAGEEWVCTGSRWNVKGSTAPVPSAPASNLKSISIFTDESVEETIADISGDIASLQEAYSENAAQYAST